MQYRTIGKNKTKVSILGIEAWNMNPIYQSNINEILEYIIENGINFIDTSYSYLPNRNKKGNCEENIGEFIKENNYRDTIKISAKMPTHLLKSKEDMNKIIEEQLKNLKTDYIDFYLLEDLDMNYWNMYKSLDIFEFLDELKENDTVKNLGFSTNCEMDMIVDITDDYENWDFGLSQLSYIDERYQSGLEGVEYLYKLGLGTIIKDPLRSNILTKNIPTQVKELWEFADKERTPLEWGLEYLWNKEEVNTVLCELSSIENISKYIEIANEVKINSISDNDQEILREMAWEYKQNKANDCTGCKHCLPCPAKVDIPSCFREYNIAKMLNNPLACKNSYFKLKENAEKCIMCGECSKYCPQMIDVEKDIQECNLLFGNLENYYEE